MKIFGRDSSDIRPLWQIPFLLLAIPLQAYVDWTETWR